MLSCCCVPLNLPFACGNARWNYMILVKPDSCFLSSKILLLLPWKELCSVWSDFCYWYRLLCKTLRSLHWIDQSLVWIVQYLLVALDTLYGCFSLFDSQGVEKNFLMSHLTCFSNVSIFIVKACLWALGNFEVLSELLASLVFSMLTCDGPDHSIPVYRKSIGLSDWQVKQYAGTQAGIAVGRHSWCY
jgi:hypothetical protein